MVADTPRQDSPSMGSSMKAACFVWEICSLLGVPISFLKLPPKGIFGSFMYFNAFFCHVCYTIYCWIIILFFSSKASSFMHPNKKWVSPISSLCISFRWVTITCPLEQWNIATLGQLCLTFSSFFVLCAAYPSSKSYDLFQVRPRNILHEEEIWCLIKNIDDP